MEVKERKKVGIRIMTICSVLFVIGWMRHSFDVMDFVLKDIAIGLIIFITWGYGWVLILIFAFGFLFWWDTNLIVGYNSKNKREGKKK